jgi:Ser/Thr protein kinase RdoA (MazF antagonist)
MKLSKPIAEGRTAEIYPWADGWILKLFHTWVSSENVAYEARINHAVYAAGIAAPKVGEVLEFNGRQGLTYERISGKTMGEVMASKPWMLFQFARKLAKLHIYIHAVEAPSDIPHLHERLRHKIMVSEGLQPKTKKHLLSNLSEMTQHNQLCHGDFHPWNVMEGNRLVAIDWVDAASGAPFADVARTSIILEGIQHMEEMVTRLEKVLVGWFHRIYLREYFTLHTADKEEYKRWLPIVAAGRLSENIPGLTPWLLTQVDKGLAL